MSLYLSPIKHRQGITLVELVVTMAIVGVLSAIALPMYQQYILRGNRAAAQAQMMDIANREQQYFMANRGYADKAALVADGFSLPSEVSSKYTYDVVVGSGSVPTFTIRFTPTGAQASDVELTLNNDGTKTPSDKW